MSEWYEIDAACTITDGYRKLEHCPACKNVAGLQEALDENASLRERIHKLEMEGSDHFYRTAYAEDANRTLEVEKTKLQAENAKLRAQLAEWKRVAESKQDIIDHMRDANAENAKLRELVRYMWREGAFEPGACYVDTERLEERTRELGIEVDE